VVEIVTQPDLAREVRQVALAARAHEFLERLVEKLALGSKPGELERFAHERIVEHYVCSHVYKCTRGCIRCQSGRMRYTTEGVAVCVDAPEPRLACDAGSRRASRGTVRYDP